VLSKENGLGIMGKSKSQRREAYISQGEVQAITDWSETGTLITPLTTLKIQINQAHVSEYQEGGIPFGLRDGLPTKSLSEPFTAASTRG